MYLDLTQTSSPQTLKVKEKHRNVPTLNAMHRRHPRSNRICKDRGSPLAVSPHFSLDFARTDTPPPLICTSDGLQPANTEEHTLKMRGVDLYRALYPTWRGTGPRRVAWTCTAPCHPQRLCVHEWACCRRKAAESDTLSVEW